MKLDDSIVVPFLVIAFMAVRKEPGTMRRQGKFKRAQALRQRKPEDSFKRHVCFGTL
jgi:hypothetical protein